MSDFESVDLTIPEDYSGLIEFINEHKEEIISNPTLYYKVLTSLDRLLNDAHNLSELHRDTSIILEAIKIQQDALLKEYKNGLTIEKIVQMANDDYLDEFFSRALNNCLRAKFVDHLGLAYQSKPQRQKIERTRYEEKTGVTSVPEELKEIEEESHTSKAIRNIKKIVEEKRIIEYFSLIIDPKSYSRTITNAFNLSLAIRMKAVSFSLNGNVLNVIPFTSENGSNEHSVLELTPRQYKNIIERFDIKEGML